MKHSFILAAIFCGALILGCSNKREGNPKVLVFSKTAGFKHASIPQGIAAIQKLGREHNFEVDTTKNAAYFEEDSLKQYAAVIFLNTTGDVLNHKEEAAFERYIQAGGGFVGVHSATDTEYDWNWYGQMVGAYFNGHPSGTPEADFIIEDHAFPATSFFTDSIWHRTDEMYNFKKINRDVNVLISIDESTYEGGTNGDNHPMSWYHEYDGGRAFYTALGHTDASYEEEEYLRHLLAGIQYAIDENEVLDYAKSRSQLPPDSDRFTKVSLVEGEFFEPTEMTILPNNNILIGQRRGEVMHFNQQTGELTEVARLDVYFKTLETPGVNAEEGLMGLQKDPDFEKNHWIYLYYSPTGDQWINRLSRFKFQEGNFDLQSEQVILEVDSQREICCHTGGSIAFGPNRMLYLSTGDNSTPFNEAEMAYVNNGFAPLNDIPGHQQYDARRSSANTNDLRGKILRIIVNEDGSYEIPQGNLFAEGTAKTRPEIFTMGHRNPYRISVDPKKGWVYWGDVGPDARADSLDTRGPRGYDEMNQAREAGNFGWPLFIADNKAYRDYDYTNGVSGAAFDPEKPINDSKNNTGLTELPEAMPAYVYYPYTESGAFPQVGTGGRNAMAGPVFYIDQYPGEKSLPAYYDGKVIIYEWMRGWMKAVSLFDDGTFNKMEPFASDISVNNLIDVEMGPDGRMYLLEYGSGWFSQNEDSGLGYIEYNGGNRPPLIDQLIVDNTSGKLPLTINARVDAVDREKDQVRYLWNLGDGTSRETSEPNITHTFENAGSYKVSVEVMDDKDAGSSSETVEVIAGNSRPEVTINLRGGNSSFYVPGRPVSYEVSVTDQDDPGQIDPSGIYVSVDYMAGMDQVNNNMGHQQVSAAVTGKALTLGLDCKTCHKEIEKSIGPTYMEVSSKYQSDPEAMVYLEKKIVEGGSGVWGEVMMPAHPDVSKDEARQIAGYIMSLSGDKTQQKSLPPSGTIIPETKGADQVMVLTASYTDKGEGNARPLTGIKSVALPSNTVMFSPKLKKEGMSDINFGGTDILLVADAEGWFALEDVDLTGVTSVDLAAGWQAPPPVGFEFEVRLENHDGEVAGRGTLSPPLSGQGTLVTIPLQKQYTGKKTLYVLYKKQGTTDEQVIVGLMNATFR
jgi:glucose/arabinose dehydrogenase/cytochrome c551/c552